MNTMCIEMHKEELQELIEYIEGDAKAFFNLEFNITDKDLLNNKECRAKVLMALDELQNRIDDMDEDKIPNYRFLILDLSRLELRVNVLRDYINSIEPG